LGAFGSFNTSSPKKIDSKPKQESSPEVRSPDSKDKTKSSKSDKKKSKKKDKSSKKRKAQESVDELK
jgi:hypothetical protein